MVSDLTNDARTYKIRAASDLLHNVRWIKKKEITNIGKIQSKLIYVGLTQLNKLTN